MPGPFTHAYAARRVADFLDAQGNFVRPEDGPLHPSQTMLPADEAAHIAALMKRWPKYTNLGAQGPDLFFFCMDFHADWVPSDEVMLALRTLYLVDDAKREDWEPFLTILDKYNHTWTGILRFLIKLDKIWQKFLQVWTDTIGRVTNAIGEVIDDLTGGLLSALGDAITALLDELVALVAQELLSSQPIFDWFSLVMAEGVDEQAYLWSDMLHYRKTNEMAANLIKQANTIVDPDNKEQFLAYAYGFLCHIGTDVIAHSFVNEQCGGPFRTHWQRHHLIENHIDAWLYRETKPGGSIAPDPFVGATDAFPSLAQSALYFAFQLTPDHPQGDSRPPILPPEGKTPEEKRARKEALDTDGEMPLWLATGIVRALIDTYYDPKNANEYPANLQGYDFQRIAVDPTWQPPDPLYDWVPPGFPLPWEVQVTYRFMLSFFKRTYMDGFDLPKPPHPRVAPFPTFDPSDLAPDFSGVNGSDPPAKQFEEIILALLEWLKKLLKHAAEFAYDAAKSIASAATYPVREEIYENITLPAWQAVRGVRDILVHLAFITPQDEEFRPDGELMHHAEIDQELIQLGHTVDGAFRQALADATDPLGNLDRDPRLIPENVRNPQDANYPYLPVEKEYRRPWAFPDTDNDGTKRDKFIRPGVNIAVEQFRTAAGPYPTHTLPDVLMRTDTPASNFLRLAYEQALTPHDTDCLSEQYVGHGPVNRAEGAIRGNGGIDPLGSPILFSAYLIGRVGADAQAELDGNRVAANQYRTSNFNLDADRGYGYLCWGWNRRQPVEEHKGYRGRTFPAPCVWPEAAEVKTGDPAAVHDGRKWDGLPANPNNAPIVKLHYKHQPDKGCDDRDMKSPDDCVQEQPPIK